MTMVLLHANPLLASSTHKIHRLKSCLFQRPFFFFLKTVKYNLTRNEKKNPWNKFNFNIKKNERNTEKMLNIVCFVVKQLFRSLFGYHVVSVENTK